MQLSYEYRGLRVGVPVSKFYSIKGTPPLFGTPPQDFPPPPSPPLAPHPMSPLHPTLDPRIPSLGPLPSGPPPGFPPSGPGGCQVVDIPNALKQPSQFQIATLKNSLKTSHKETYISAVRRQIRETCPFNIYGRIIFKSRSGCAYYYSLLAYKKNKTLLWENSRLSLERDWENTM